MIDSLASIFSESGFMPHGHCFLWKPGLVWTHVITDSLIGLAYLSISLSLYILIRKIRLPFSAVVLSFGIFIGACGATHFMEVWNLWYADYWLAGFVKTVTAAASVSTGVWLIRLKPQIIQVADAARLSEERREQLEVLNRDLLTKKDELEKTNAILEEQQKMLAHSARMSALGEMAGGIAHEINSPLGIITIRANQLERMLKRDLLTPEIIQNEARLIGTTAQRIGEIIKGLRTFAREGEKDPFYLTPVATIIRDTLVLCKTRFESHGIEMILDPVPEDLAIECRSVQIGQVLLNLLNNSHDAIHTLPVPWVRITVRDLGEDVEIAVTDSGPGIPEKIQLRMMQPFFTTKEVGNGTGLGLSISKGIVENHLGKLHYDYESPHTRFTVRLPKKHPRVPPAGTSR